MRYAIDRLRKNPQYQELIKDAYLNMSEITGRPDPSDDVARIMTLIEQGQGVDPMQIGKDVSFYTSRAYMVLFKLPWRIADIASFFTGVISVSEEHWELSGATCQPCMHDPEFYCHSWGQAALSGQSCVRPVTSSCLFPLFLCHALLSLLWPSHVTRDPEAWHTYSCSLLLHHELPCPHYTFCKLIIFCPTCRCPGTCRRSSRMTWRPATALLTRTKSTSRLATRLSRSRRGPRSKWNRRQRPRMAPRLPMVCRASWRWMANRFPPCLHLGSRNPNGWTSIGRRG